MSDERVRGMMGRRFDRRTVLKVLGAGSVLTLLQACGGENPTVTPGRGGVPTLPAASTARATSAAGAAWRWAGPSRARPRAGPPGGGGGAGGPPVTVGGFPSKTLRIMAPAAPGGGWDTTSRKVQEVLQGQKIAAQSIEVVNRPGAGGTVGLAELINQNRGDGHTVMTMGLVMTGAIETNKSPVKLDTTVPLARLTTEYEAIAVGKDSKYQTA